MRSVQTMGSTHAQRFHIAEHLRREPGDWQTFTHETDGLQHPNTQRERGEIAQVLTELAAYRAEAYVIASRSRHDTADVLDVLSKIENASQKLLGVGYDLASTHRAASGTTGCGRSKVTGSLVRNRIRRPGTAYDSRWPINSVVLQTFQSIS